MSANEGRESSLGGPRNPDTSKENMTGKPITKPGVEIVAPYKDGLFRILDNRPKQQAYLSIKGTQEALILRV
jgi:hypothetical protein